MMAHFIPISMEVVVKQSFTKIFADLREMAKPKIYAVVTTTYKIETRVTDYNVKVLVKSEIYDVIMKHLACY